MHKTILQLLGLVLLASTHAAEPKIYKDKIEPHWFNSGRKFWYRNDLRGDRREFILVDAEHGTREPAFDHKRVAKVLAERTGKEIDPEHLPFESIQFSDDGKTFQVFGDNLAWKFDFEKYEVSEDKNTKPDKTETPREERRQRRSREWASAKSPDGKYEVVMQGDNLFLKEDGTEKERQVSFDGNPGNTYKRSAQRDRLVGMQFEAKDPEKPTPEIYWAPDSKHFVAMRTRPGTERLVYLVESSPKDQLQPKLQSYPYAKPGDEIAISKPHLFEVAGGKEIPLDDAFYANPWSITDIRWEKDSSRFTFLFNQRGHQVLRILAVDAASGETKPIVDEKSETFIAYSGKFFSEYLDDSNEIIWMSERDGWNHLYLYDAKTGGVKNQITRGEWVVRGVDKVDSEHRQVWFHAGGIRSEQDPYYIHYCRINFDGSGLVILTEGNGTHAIKYSPDRKYFIDTWSRVDVPPVNELRGISDGKLLCKLEETDVSELREIGRQAPEPFVAKGRDGSTDIYGVIYRPKNLDEKKSYPIIESIYAGPHDSFVPKAFRAGGGDREKLINCGFILVQIDGMGTSNRSKKFHDVCWKNIADSGFPDRILWLKALAKKYPYVDLARVGIYGTSAGGQSALAGLLTHSDFYKAGISDSGCHDNRMDKIWWNEQWMGWPVGPHYDEQSNVTMANRLQGKLLLMVGELDKNVDPFSTMQVVNALIKADKNFELLVYPGGGHGILRTKYGWQRLEEFFTRNLLINKEQTTAPKSVATAK
jgi:dipeptidyl-peptidase-4